MNEKAKAALAKYREEVRLGIRPKPVRKHGVVSRVANMPLGGAFAADRGRRLRVTIVLGTDRVPDIIKIAPCGTRREETVTLEDLYLFAIRCRTNKAHLEKARNTKEKIKARRLSQRIARADRRLTR